MTEMLSHIGIHTNIHTHIYIYNCTSQYYTIWYSTTKYEHSFTTTLVLLINYRVYTRICNVYHDPRVTLSNLYIGRHYVPMRFNENLTITRSLI